MSHDANLLLNEGLLLIQECEKYPVDMLSLLSVVSGTSEAPKTIPELIKSEHYKNLVQYSLQTLQHRSDLAASECQKINLVLPFNLMNIKDVVLYQHRSQCY